MSLKKSLERLEELTKKMVTAETDGAEVSSSGVATLTLSDGANRKQRPYDPYRQPRKPSEKRPIKTAPRKPQKLKLDVKKNALAKVGELFKAYNAGKAASPHKPPSYKSVKAKRGPMGPVNPTKKTDMEPKVSAYGHIADAKQRTKEQARGSARQKLGEQRKNVKPDLPGSKPPSALDPAMGRMRNMVHSFKSFKKSYDEINRKE